MIQYQKKIKVKQLFYLLCLQTSLHQGLCPAPAISSTAKHNKLWSFISAAKSLLYLTVGMCYKAAGHTNTPQGKLSIHNGVLSFIAWGFGCIMEAGCHEWGTAGSHYGQKLLAPLVCPDTDHTHHLFPVLCHFEEKHPV